MKRSAYDQRSRLFPEDPVTGEPVKREKPKKFYPRPDSDFHLIEHYSERVFFDALVIMAMEALS